MFFPPVAYFGTAHFLEKNLENKYFEEIEKSYLGDLKLLFDGRLKLKDVVNENINNYLANRSVIFNEIEVKVTVSTRQGEMIYPFLTDRIDHSFVVDDYLTVASENYRILDDGLEVRLETSIERDSLISIAIFLFFLFISLIFLYLCYRYERKKIKLLTDKTNSEINRLREDESVNNRKLTGLLQESEILKESLSKIKKQATEATMSEDDMLEEVIRLEEEVADNLSLQQGQQKEIDILNEQIEKLKYGKKGGKQKIKNREMTVKRFKALYKNVVFNERAIDNYVELEEDLKLKCEEIIHQLNDMPDKVTIKRKVFGRKGRVTVLEVIFAYKGRLYFRKNEGGKAEVLTVGTKNSQAKELEYLDKL